MAKATTRKKAKIEQPRRTPVVRDSTFARAVADSGLVIDLGRDLELAFLQVGPILKERQRKGREESLEEGFELEPTLTEVARIRMPPPQAFGMAMHIIQIMIEEDRIHTEPFLAQINKLVDEAKMSHAVAEGDE